MIAIVIKHNYWMHKTYPQLYINVETIELNDQQEIIRQAHTLHETDSAIYVSLNTNTRKYIQIRNFYFEL